MSTPSTSWHRFVEDEVGDDTCSRCHVQVTLEAHMTFSLPCPTGDCQSPKNPDRGCVFAPSGSAPARCLFCGRTGSREDEVEDTSILPLEDLTDDPDEVLADSP